MRLSELVPPGAETGTGLALQHRGRYLFGLAGPGHAGPQEARFYGIGGHLEHEESWLACAEREAREELGCEVSLHPAAQTTYIAREGDCQPVAVDDDPRPLCIYELWEPPDAPWNKRRVGSIYYVVIYAATLDDSIEPDPLDVDALLWLAPAQIRRTAKGPTTLQALLDDGAQVRTRVPLPGHLILRPQGTACALSLLWSVASGQ